MPDELYSVLGVRKGATAGEIRDAYRKLAKKHHPDLNPGDTAAEDAFRKVQAAYDILSDKEKRKKYDLGEIDAEGRETPRHFYCEYATAGGGEHPYHSSAGFDDLGHIFEDLFRAQGAGGPEGPEGVHIRMTGGDTHYRMEVGFLEAVKGAKKRITLPDGKALDVVIPPGHGDGQMLRLRGKGMPGLGGGEAGDAYVEVRVRPHKHFRRRGRDILLELPVAIDEAVLGAKVRVPTVTGTVTMTIPAGANGGDVLRLKGRGVLETGTGKHKQKAGDQLVTLTVVLPEKADAGLEEFLAEWAKDHKYDPRKGLGGDGR